jgi:hypothetical protein
LIRPPITIGGAAAGGVQEWAFGFGIHKVCNVMGEKKDSLITLQRKIASGFLANELRPEKPLIFNL